MNLQHALRAVDDGDLERAVENALQVIDKADVAGPSKISQYRDAFSRYLAKLKAEIDGVNADVVAATKARDEVIMLANEQHASAVAAAEKKLYQATTIRSVIETAHATLTQARDE
jgi:hypothetical protein